MADLQAQHRPIRQQIDEAIREVLDKASFGLGDNVKALEREVAEYSGARFGAGVASGTDAIALALLALGVKAGDEVITTPFTFVATTEVIALIGAKPVYADIDPRTFNLDPSKIEEKITSKTKAIVPVHLFGQAADVVAIREIADRHGLKVVWDGAQAIGTTVGGKPIGAYDDALTLSFFPAKNLGGIGDGGMVLTNDEEALEKLRYLRFHGSGGTYSYKYIGYCSRLDEIQAAVLRVKLPLLDGWTDLRRRNAAIYREMLADLDVTLPKVGEGNNHTYYQFTIRCKRRDELRSCLSGKGIASGVYYPGPLHLEEAYRYLGYAVGDFPEAEFASREVLSLPVCPELSEEQVQYVAEAIRSFYR